MNLYFNGCSFTHGDELENPQQHSWPTLVSSRLNCDFLNDAVTGGTNDRIVYKTLLNLKKYDFFIIAWTSYSRFTEYNPVDNFEINFNPQLNTNAALHRSDDLKKNYPKYKTYGETYYKHWYNDLFEFKKWLQQIILLQSFFKQNNKPFIMLNTMKNNISSWSQPQENFIPAVRHLIDFFDYIDDDQLLAEHLQIQDLLSMIDKSTFIAWGDWDIKELTSVYPTGPGGHILEDGHRAVADIVLDHYNKTSR